MQRQTIEPRSDWRRRCAEVGFSWHSMGGVYWDESACYAFDEAQIDHLESVTAELHGMCLRAAAEVVAARSFAQFAIPEAFHDLVARSWRNVDPTLYGRFDLSWDGRGEPKLLEYNADTPTALLEASVVQWQWLEDVKPKADQFNSLHEKLVERWKTLATVAGPNRVHVACVRDSEEDLGNVEYLRDCALQAGWDARPLYMEDLGWDGERFVDLDDEPVRTLFKLYPWEWLVREEFGVHLGSTGMKVLEPAWKLLLSNKALLVALWHLYPGHANLLPAYFDADALPGEYVKKPLLAREGANVTLKTKDGELTEDGGYGGEGFVYQGVAKLPDFGGRYPVIGSWIVGDQPAGIGIREDASPITRNSSRFVPHYFT
ncbi:MAG TPA: glutathionylspermidine synthase family protein [Burkholderiales bacterium]|nr:glutathionylspermidine synthase family protein [Burkholderiales bacterium]